MIKVSKESQVPYCIKSDIGGFVNKSQKDNYTNFDDYIDEEKDGYDREHQTGTYANKDNVFVNTGTFQGDISMSSKDISSKEDISDR